MNHFLFFFLRFAGGSCFRLSSPGLGSFKAATNCSWISSVSIISPFAHPRCWHAQAGLHAFLLSLQPHALVEQGRFLPPLQPHFLTSLYVWEDLEYLFAFFCALFSFPNKICFRLFFGLFRTLNRHSLSPSFLLTMISHLIFQALCLL